MPAAWALSNRHSILKDSRKFKARYHRHVFIIERADLKGLDFKTKQNNSRTRLGKLTDKLYPLSTLKWKYVSDNSVFNVNWTNVLHNQRKRLWSRRFISIHDHQKTTGSSPLCHLFQVWFSIWRPPWSHQSSAVWDFYKQAISSSKIRLLAWCILLYEKHASWTDVKIPRTLSFSFSVVSVSQANRWD